MQQRPRRSASTAFISGRPSIVAARARVARLPVEDRHVRHARHQSDHVDQRRHAGARRRHSARGLPGGGAHWPATPASSSAASFRARPTCCGRSSRATGSSSFPAGTARNCAGAPPLRKIAAVADHLDLLAAMGCTVMVFAEGHGSTDGNPRRRCRADPCWPMPTWPAFCARLNDVARHLRRRGVRLAFHHHMGTVVQTEAEIDRLMANTDDDVGLLLDTGHLVFAGGDPVGGRAAARHAHRARALQGRPRRRARTTCCATIAAFCGAVLDGVFTVPGDGSIDFTAVLRELRTCGLCGLARRRGRAGSGQGASAHLCAHGLRESEARAPATPDSPSRCVHDMSVRAIRRENRMMRVLSRRRRLHRPAPRGEHRRASARAARAGSSISTSAAARDARDEIRRAGDGEPRRGACRSGRRRSDDLHAAAHARGDHRARGARRQGGVLRKAGRSRHEPRRRVRDGARRNAARRSSSRSTGASIRPIARCSTRSARRDRPAGNAGAVEPRPGDLAARLRRRDAVRHFLRHDDPRLRHGALATRRRAGRDRRAHRVHARREGESAPRSRHRDGRC